MKNVLICSIIRNQEHNLDLWYNQLISLVDKILSEYNCYLSVFENDSIDKTKEKLKSYDFGRFSESLISLETIGSQQFGSIYSVERLKNLAFYRQSCIDKFRGKYPLIKLDKIAYIEPDVKYDSNWCKELILANHFKQFGVEPDIYSGWSLRSEKNPKESMFLYDTSATRRYPNEKEYIFNNEHNFFGTSLIKTQLSHLDSNCIHHFWSTFNCFCVYNAEPFNNGLTWGYINKRFDNGQIKLENGWLECDTVAICEDFRSLEYNKICVNRNCIVRHLD